MNFTPIKPIVRIQIVTYNSEKDILTCLANVYTQKGDFNKEIFIIDNASTDETVSLVQSHYKDVNILQNFINNGYAGGHNIGLKSNGKYDYILTLNPDIKLKGNYIQSLIEVLSSNPKLGSASGLLLRSDEEIIDSQGVGLRKNRRPFDIGQDTLVSKENSKRMIFGPCGAAAMYRRSFIEDVMINLEFFDEDFFAYKEDVDICWRGQLFGWSSIFVPSAVAIHERGWKHNSREKVSRLVKIHSFKNRYLLIIKNDDFINICYHIPWILVFEVMAFFYILIKEPYLIRAWIKLWKLTSSALIKRKQIMSKRKVSPKEIRKWFK